MSDLVHIYIPEKPRRSIHSPSITICRHTPISVKSGTNNEHFTRKPTSILSRIPSWTLSIPFLIKPTFLKSVLFQCSGGRTGHTATAALPTDRARILRTFCLFRKDQDNKVHALNVNRFANSAILLETRDYTTLHTPLVLAVS